MSTRTLANHAAAALLAFAASSTLAAGVTNWAVDTTLTPGDVVSSLVTSGLGTSSPTIGDGSPENADGAAIVSSLPGGTMNLEVNDRITLTGTITVSGIIAGGEKTAFRYGLLYEPDDPAGNGAAGDFAGWMGYMADNSNTGSPEESNNGEAVLLARDATGADFDSVTWASITSGRGVRIGEDTEQLDGESFFDDSYAFSMVVARGDLGLTVYSSIEGVGSTTFSDSMQSEVISDGNLVTNVFNRVALWVPSGGDPDQAAFSNVDVVKAKRSDFNADGVVDADDYNLHFLPGFPSPDLAGLSWPEAYLSGDLDADGDVDLFDFEVFRADFIADNTPAAFAALVSGVPEPTTLAVIGVLAVSLLAQRRPRVLAALLIGCVLSMTAAPSQAQISNWFRFGDDDLNGLPGVGPPTPPTDGGAIEYSLNNEAFDPDPNNIEPVDYIFPAANSDPSYYSTQVPAPTIVDPLDLGGNGGKYLNEYSYHTTQEGGSRQRLQTTGGPAIASTFTYEAFIRVDAPSSDEVLTFAYQAQGATGGFNTRLLSRGRLRLNLRGDDGTGTSADHQFISPDNAMPQDGQWRHIGIIFTGNSQDGSSDTYMYVDHELVRAFNFPDTSSYPTIPNSLASMFFGEVFGRDADAYIDESRLLDYPLALDGSEFLRAGSLRAVVNAGTGEVTLVNDTLQTIDINSYQITSPAGRLLTGDSDWNSLADNDSAWDEGAGSSSESLGELNLLGANTLAPGAEFSIGAPYATGPIDDDLTIQYGDIARGGIFNAYVEFIAAPEIDGDYNGDGAVNAADYTVWRDNQGQSVTLPGDTTPGTVTQADYDVWAANFGATVGGGEAATAAPEPGAVMQTAILAAVCLACQSLLRTRRAAPTPTCC